MMDQIFDRNYQEGRAALNDGIDRLVSSISTELGKSMNAVHRFEWSAPWARKASTKNLRSA